MLMKGDMMKLLGKIGLILFIMAMICYRYSQINFLNEINEVKNVKTSPLKVEVQRKSGVETLDMNTYLIGVVASEMSPTYELEALKAQCVAARTFVTSRNYQVDDTTNTQVYRDNNQLKEAWGYSFKTYYQKVKEAVLATEDEILTYHGEVISALFYAQSCGKSANAKDYFGSDIPYLVSVDSASDKQEVDHVQEVCIDVATFMQKLQLDDVPYRVDVPIRYASGYVNTWQINAQVFSGREVREALGLRSSAFEVTFDGNAFTFITKGFGHGVGMSQRGANAMAKKGFDYQQILKHYYRGVDIIKKTYK